MKDSFHIVVPTYNGGQKLIRCLGRIRKFWEKLVILDSGSTDGTVEYLKQMNLSYRTIPTDSFNHGATREHARKLLDTEVVVFLTQDVLVESVKSIQMLVQPIVDGKADVTYGRQLPNRNADFFEGFPRQFNYSEQSHVRSLKDVGSYGFYTFFCSDAFAAYSQKALDQVGGFEATLTHEDYFAVAKILKQGGKIAYVSKAEIVHSHKYSLLQEFQRYFDAGYVRAVNPWVTSLVGHAESHGSHFFKSMLKRLAHEDPKLIPFAFIQTAVKWLGYRTGFCCFQAPTWVKKSLSGQPYYFDSKFYIPGKN